MSNPYIHTCVKCGFTEHAERTANQATEVNKCEATGEYMCWFCYMWGNGHPEVRKQRSGRKWKP